MLNVEYIIRDVFGTETRYPANDAARLICELAGTKTITAAMRTAVLAYGGTMTQVMRPTAQS